MVLVARGITSGLSSTTSGATALAKPGVALAARGLQTLGSKVGCGAPGHHLDMPAYAGKGELEHLGLVAVSLVLRVRGSTAAGLHHPCASSPPVVLDVLRPSPAHAAVQLEQSVLIQLDQGFPLGLTHEPTFSLCHRVEDGLVHRTPFHRDWRDSAQHLPTSLGLETFVASQWRGALNRLRGS